MTYKIETEFINESKHWLHVYSIYYTCVRNSLCMYERKHRLSWAAMIYDCYEESSDLFA